VETSPEKPEPVV
jgi:hypothetical protein